MHPSLCIQSSQDSTESRYVLILERSTHLKVWRWWWWRFFFFSIPARALNTFLIILAVAVSVQISRAHRPPVWLPLPFAEAQHVSPVLRDHDILLSWLFSTAESWVTNVGVEIEIKNNKPTGKYKCKVKKTPCHGHGSY